MRHKLKEKLLLCFIVLIACTVRFIGLNWDQGQHLHPDERFLTMVGTAAKIPTTFSTYFNQSISTLNPANIGFPFYVYGILPLSLNKILAVWFNNDNYALFTLQGRMLSAVFDLFTLILVFKIVSLLEKHYHLNHTMKYFAIFFYAIAVLPIQLAHFFAVDTFLTCFMFAAFYWMLRYYEKNHLLFLILSSIFFGFAVATKVSSLFIAPLLAYFFILHYGKVLWRHKKHSVFKTIITNQTNIQFFMTALGYCLLVYATVRLTDPYLFQSPNFFDPHPSTLFIQNLQALKGWEGPDTQFPPNIQWLSKLPIIFALRNIALFGVGLPYFLLIVSGIILITKDHKKTPLFPTIIWAGLFFLYQSTTFTKAMRYFIFLYPFFAIYAAFTIEYLSKRISKPLLILIIAIVSLYPAMFLSIYLHKHSRVQASEWIYAKLPTNSVILAEYWDDALPLPVLDQYGKQFQIEELPVFDPDTPEKWNKMRPLLENADYYILTSNRGWGSIPTAPRKYPIMTKFYKDLLSGKTNYKKIADFTSYPSLSYLGIPITVSDDDAEEAFTVYDHPRVMVFKKE